MPNPDEETNGPRERGNLYFCVKVPVHVCGKKEIYIWADEWLVESGHLFFFLVRFGEPKKMNMVFAPGHWNTVFAASIMDGHACAVEHWEGEVVR